jgi:hypothetical protein
MFAHFDAHPLACVFAHRWSGKTVALCLQIIRDLKTIRPLPEIVVFDNKTLYSITPCLATLRGLMAADAAFSLKERRVTSFNVEIDGKLVHVTFFRPSFLRSITAASWFYFDDFIFADRARLECPALLNAPVVRAAATPRSDQGPCVSFERQIRQEVLGLEGDRVDFERRATAQNPFTTIDPRIVPLVLYGGHVREKL